ncbi:hypothetical protein [Rhodococcus oxybenzonivorans]|uniref:hypothetical protein n=1 Tax=Rhodococcus oxybenzonivorans TaxID=1990687 RepID=UPI0013A52FFB|nr:hypothetical protein [Rhodococcus oxybenzonivorans]
MSIALTMKIRERPQVEWVGESLTMVRAGPGSRAQVGWTMPTVRMSASQMKKTGRSVFRSQKKGEGQTSHIPGADQHDTSCPGAVAEPSGDGDGHERDGTGQADAERADLRGDVAELGDRTARRS